MTSFIIILLSDVPSIRPQTFPLFDWVSIQRFKISSGWKCRHYSFIVFSCKPYRGMTLSKLHQLMFTDKVGHQSLKLHNYF